MGCFRWKLLALIDDQYRWRARRSLSSTQFRNCHLTRYQHQDELTSLKGLNCRQSLRTPPPRHMHALRDPVQARLVSTHGRGHFLSQIDRERLLGVNGDRQTRGGPGTAIIITCTCVRISSGGQGDRGIDTAISHYYRAGHNSVLNGELRENFARPEHLR